MRAEPSCRGLVRYYRDRHRTPAWCCHGVMPGEGDAVNLAGAWYGFSER